jgi:hypothetical protein
VTGIAGEAEVRGRVAAALVALDAERPQFHYVDGKAMEWSIGAPTQQWMLDFLPSTRRTLETGCGFTTVLFAAGGTDHTVVTPSADEVGRVQAFCADHGIAFDAVRPAVGDSTRILQALELGELDLVLIDGGHAFPIPCIDWFFTQGALRVGGHVVVDDFRMPSVHQLVDFLRAETPTWREVAVAGNSVIFQKLGHDDFSRDWEGQHVNRNALQPTLPRRIELKVRRTLRDPGSLFSRGTQ